MYGLTHPRLCHATHTATAYPVELRHRDMESQLTISSACQHLYLKKTVII